MRRGRLWITLALFAAVFLVHALSPVPASGDSRWTVPTALSLLDRGDLNLDEYQREMTASGYYAIECVSLDRTRRVYPLDTRPDAAAACAGSHHYTVFPLAGPVLSAAVIGPLRWAVVTARPLLSTPPAGTAARRALIEGDFVNAHAAVEILAASVFVALAVVLMFLLAREYLPLGPALCAALVFAFASPAWSVASRSLSMHGFSMVLLAAALLALVRSSRDMRWWMLCGAALATAYFVRPTNAIPAAVIGLLAWRAGRPAVLRFAAGAVVPCLLFGWMNLSIYGWPLSPYQLGHGGGSMSISAALLESLPGNWISPARGLLVYSPWVVFALAGWVAWTHKPERRVLAHALSSIIVLHWLAVSCFSPWWAGSAFGPRYMSDILPVIALLVVAWLEGWRQRPLWTRAALATCVLAGLFIHSQGTLRPECMEWNGDPVALVSRPERVWDWRDPAFLRGFRK